MREYERATSVVAIQFDEDRYVSNSLLYPEVFDKALLSESWWSKGAEEGRYYIISQPNTFKGTSEYITVNSGDYIIREGMGVVHAMPKELFEKNYKEV